MYHRAAAVRNTVIAVVVLATLYFLLFHDLFSKIYTLRTDVLGALKVSSPIQTISPSPFAVEDAEKWKNFFLLNNNIPIGWYIYFQYAQNQIQK
jgi:hypothetical protein